METKWRNEYRSCERCKAEYQPQREAQSYCSPACRRAAAYGRERFRNGTKGRRRRHLEASDNLPATLIAGSFRNGDFSSIETGSCRPTNWIEKLNQEVSNEIERAYWTREKRKWPVISWVAIDSQASELSRCDRPNVRLVPLADVLSPATNGESPNPM